MLLQKILVLQLSIIRLFVFEQAILYSCSSSLKMIVCAQLPFLARHGFILTWDRGNIPN